MNNNDTLRMFRYALDLSDKAMLELFQLSDYALDRTDLDAFLKREEEEGCIICSDHVVELFFDGLILQRRGPQKNPPAEPKAPAPKLNNNEVLKKIKIALQLTSEDMQVILLSAGMALSKSEFNALLQRKSHKNYKLCGDQVLRNFLKGLALKYRKTKPNKVD